MGSPYIYMWLLGNNNPKLGRFNKGKLMSEFKQYRRKSVSEMREYEEGENMDGVSISQPDKDAGSPKIGDYIARNPKNHADQWLVAKAYFEDNLEPIVKVV